jgi:hypothetical protein
MMLKIPTVRHLHQILRLRNFSEVAGKVVLVVSHCRRVVFPVVASYVVVGAMMEQ